jgi:hypothetical protein
MSCKTAAFLCVLNDRLAGRTVRVTVLPGICRVRFQSAKQPRTFVRYRPCPSPQTSSACVGLSFSLCATRRTRVIAQRIIDALPFLNGHGNQCVFLCLLGRPGERRAPHVQGACHLAFPRGAIGPAQLRGPFHLVCRVARVGIHARGFVLELLLPADHLRTRDAERPAGGRPSLFLAERSP